MLWLRVALLGVILAAVAGAVFKVTSYLHDKDLMIQERDQQILNLNAQVAGMKIDSDRLKQSNASLEAEVAKKRDELAQAELEAKKISLADQESSRRLGELERKLNNQDRIAKIERLSRSRRADLVLKIVNRSTECELDNFFRTDGQCKGGKWVPEGGRLVPKTEAPAPAEAQGANK